MAGKTQFVREVEEQPAALRRLMEYYRGEGRPALEDAAGLCEIDAGGRLIFTGMGTALVAPVAVYDMLAGCTGLPVAIDAGELLHHNLAGVRTGDAVIGISQSGESIETRTVFERLAGHPSLLAITNDPDSAMGRLAGVVLPMLAGAETSISCKTYSNSLALLLLLAAECIREGQDAVMDDLRRCAEGMEAFLDHPIRRAAADFLKDASYLCFIARGPSMAAAQQAALTWMEGAHMPAAALTGGSFRHGPLEMVRPGFHAVCYAPEGHSGGLVEKLAREIAELGGHVLAFSGRGMAPGERVHVVEVDPGAGRLFPLATAVPQALLLAEMARDRGWEAGVFAHGGKVTTEE